MANQRRLPYQGTAYLSPQSQQPAELTHGRWWESEAEGVRMPMSIAGQAEISLLPGRALEPQTAPSWARGLPPVPSSSLISKVYSPPDLHVCRWAQILFQ